MTPNDEAVITRVMAGRLTEADDATALARAFVYMVEQWKSTARDTYMSGGGKAPDWLEFEFRTWELGEALRQILESRKDLQTNEAVLDMAARIVADSELARGRQPYVELVGRFAAHRNRQLLLGLLNDPWVAGHAIKALRVGKVRGCSPEVRAVMDHLGHEWQRREAIKYLSFAAERDEP